MKSIELFDLSAEISSASALIMGIANQCDDACDRLNDEYLRLALFGVSKLLERISEDIDKFRFGSKFSEDIMHQLEVIADEANDKIMIAEGKEQYWDGYEDGITKALEVIKAGASDGSL